MNRGSHHYPDNTTTASSYSEDEDRHSSMYDRMATNAGRLLPNGQVVYPSHPHEDAGASEDEEDEENGSNADAGVPNTGEESKTNGNSAKPTPIPWGSMYKQLLEYYKEHGHTKVKLIRGKNDRFVTWVRNQKTILGKAKREKTSLTATMSERIAKLDDIHFDWPKPITNAAPAGPIRFTQTAPSPPPPSSSNNNNKIKESSTTTTTATSLKHTTTKPETSFKKQEAAKSNRSSPKTIKIQKALPFKKRSAIPRQEEPQMADSSSLSTADTSGDEVSLRDEEAVIVAAPPPPTSVAAPPLPAKKKTVVAEDKEGATTWDAFYEQLQAFYEKHGHTKVKLLRGENDKFVNWIRNQKTFLGKIRRRSKPLPETDIKAIRIGKLDAIEFDWPKPIGGAGGVGGGGETHSVGEQQETTVPTPPIETKHSTVSDEGSNSIKKISLKKKKKKRSATSQENMDMETSSSAKKPRTIKSEDVTIKSEDVTIKSEDAAMLETVGLDEQNAAKALLCLVGAW